MKLKDINSNVLIDLDTQAKTTLVNTISYSKSNGSVILSFDGTAVSTSQTSISAKLPEGFRPPRQVRGLVRDSSLAIVVVTILSDGTIQTIGNQTSTMYGEVIYPVNS